MAETNGNSVGNGNAHYTVIRAALLISNSMDLIAKFLHFFIHSFYLVVHTKANAIINDSKTTLLDV